jgi:hypothetical protein
MRYTLVAGLALLLPSLETRADDLHILPADTTLTGPQAGQRLVVVAEDSRQVVDDRTSKVEFASSNSAVATVDQGGMVRPVTDGEAIITASEEGRKATAHVKVVQTRAPFTWSFRNHVIPMMTKIGCNSGACHGALAGKNGFKLSLRGYAPFDDYFVLTRQALGRRVDTVEPSRSLLLRKPTLVVPHGGGLKLELGSPDFQLLADWIASGAPGPKDDDPRLVRLEVFPSHAVLKPKDTLQILVRGHYSDGHMEDVTRWVKFSSTEDQVAAVDPEGKVRVAGYGEAAITIWYSNLVATSRITSPLPNRIDRGVFARAERHNFIDDLVLKKLAALHIPPSPLCSDAEFLRRVELDATGTLPTPAELQRFLGDSSSDKRAKRIDQLLDRPQFVDYWAYKWSDLLLVSTRKLPQPEVWAFYQFIRQSVAENKPWDRFAREILTATGNTLDNGAANYFALHKDVAELTEATSVTFLGMSITCCRCHNHPLEKWTQDQYWSMANLFSRVALKNGEDKSVSVQSQPFGDVPHPRRGTVMPPAPLDGKPLPQDSTVDRRQYFADWLTAPDNPYFARAIVNRVWRNYLGRGLVEAEDDLRQTNPPTNSELLDALTQDFIDHQFDMKHLMRTILNSATYQRSSLPLPGNATDDRFYSHYLIRRLAAEVILDAYAQITGVPTPFTQIEAAGRIDRQAYTGAPLGTRALQLPDSLVVSPFLESFGRPLRSQPCACERQQDASVGQALHLNNGQTLNDKLRDPHSLVQKWLDERITDEEAVRRLFRLALCREPQAEEMLKFKHLLAEASHDKSETQRHVLEDLLWSVLTSREFLFNR